MASQRKQIQIWGACLLVAQLIYAVQWGLSHTHNLYPGIVTSPDGQWGVNARLDAPGPSPLIVYPMSRRNPPRNVSIPDALPGSDIDQPLLIVWEASSRRFAWCFRSRHDGMIRAAAFAIASDPDSRAPLKVRRTEGGPWILEALQQQSSSRDRDRRQIAADCLTGLQSTSSHDILFAHPGNVTPDASYGAGRLYPPEGITTPPATVYDEH